MALEIGPRLKQLKNFLMDPNSEESKSYISKLLSRKLTRPEETFVHEILNADFWKEMGYSKDEANFEAPADVKGRVEWSLEIDGKKIAVECKKPYLLKKDKEVIHQLDGSDIDELEDQLGRYLSTHDYIIYTNGFHWYFYSQLSYRAWSTKKKNIELKPYFKHLTSDDIFKEDSSDYILNILPRNIILQSLSGMEHKSIRQPLTDDFFDDLKNWVRYIDDALTQFKESKKAKTTSLINKFIFLRTMEAVGVIPLDFLSKNWEVKKGVGTSVHNFIEQLDNDFSGYYNTELFSSRFFEDEDGNVIEKDGEPLENPLRRENYIYRKIPEDFFSALFKKLDETNPKDTGITKLILNDKDYYIRSLYWWKFEKIHADILGKAYETYLARERKKLGIYYTPHQMTEFLTSKSVSIVFDKKIFELKSELNKEEWDVKKLNLLGEQIVDLKICDPSCGSGSFLIQAIRMVLQKYKELENIIKEKDEQITKGKPTLDVLFTNKVAVLRFYQELLKIDDKQQRLGVIILRHIYGNDKDPKAIDTAKLNIWLECLRLDPNTYRLENIKGKRHVLPSLELNLTVGDSLVDLDVNEVDIGMKSESTETIKGIFRAKELYASSFDKTRISQDAATKRDLLKELHLDKTFSEKFGKEFTDDLFSVLRPSYWPLQHMSAYYNKNGELKEEEERGFDVIIGNPPWEILEPNIDEFYGPHHNKDDMTRFYELKKNEKDKIIKELKKNPKIVSDWKRYNKEIDLQREFFRKSKSFKYQTAKTDAPQNTIRPNFYKLFIEKYYYLLKKGGIAGIVIPAHFYTNLGTKGLRQLIFENTKIITLLSFLNKNKIFNIHPQLNFINLIFEKGGETSKFKAAFKLLDVNDLDSIEKNAIMYDIALIKQGSPDSLSMIETNNQEDVDIIKKLLKFPLLLEKSQWKIRFQREFNMSDDAYLFNTNANGPPLFEGGMIHQFTHEFSKPEYWIEEKKGIDVLKKLQTSRILKKMKKNQLHSLQKEQE